MFRQYLTAKSEHKDAILLFRMGDFYEMFYEDALIASKALALTLTARGKGTSSEAPMCGVPFHAVDGYIARLVRMGHRVAVCEQTEDPRSAKGLVTREVVRVLSPGTMTDPLALEARVPVYVAALACGPASIGLALADLSTGEFLAWEGDPEHAREILAGYSPSEIVHREGDPPPEPLVGASRSGPLLSSRPGWTFSDTSARSGLMAHFQVATLDGFGLAGRPQAVAAAGALIAFLQDTQKAPLAHIDSLKLIDAQRCLVLDQTTRRNLEIVKSLCAEGERATLVGVLDLTLTGMGGRLIRDWLLRPLVERTEIEARLEAVGEMVEQRAPREALRAILGSLPDLERLLGRVSLRKAGPRELLALRKALEALPLVRATLAELRSDLLQDVTGRIGDLAALADFLARAIPEDPPPHTREGGIIRDGFDPDVDRWRAAQRSARSMLVELEVRERKRTGIGNLKVRYNSVFGYYIEVSRSNLGNVPADYVRKQTLVGAERFLTEELKEFEETLLKAQTELLDHERRLFGAVLDQAAREAPAIRESARALAELDVLACFAECAERHRYVRPRLVEEPLLRITEGRHPVVERLGAAERFIPNDLTMDTEASQVLILTGPNMGGKSTYLRQTALIVLMAQAGSFVPAESAEIGIADRIFCRVGASDNLAGGQSTFLVEMSETANILHSATSRSLVLLDEIGRGTATFDGLSIAWAVAEWLHDNPAARPRALFATHYHELTELALVFPRIRNLHISAREYKDTVLFLRRVEDGPADRSYGIQVARLAGLPRAVLTRAREILENLERNEFGRDGRPSIARTRSGAPGLDQLPLFVPASDSPSPLFLEELRALDTDRLTPLEALGLIARWKKEVE